MGQVSSSQRLVYSELASGEITKEECDVVRLFPKAMFIHCSPEDAIFSYKHPLADTSPGKRETAFVSKTSDLIDNLKLAASLSRFGNCYNFARYEKSFVCHSPKAMTKLGCPKLGAPAFFALVNLNETRPVTELNLEENDLLAVLFQLCYTARELEFLGLGADISASKIYAKIPEKTFVYFTEGVFYSFSDVPFIVLTHINNEPVELNTLLEGFGSLNSLAKEMIKRIKSTSLEKVLSSELFARFRYFNYDDIPLPMFLNEEVLPETVLGPYFAVSVLSSESPVKTSNKILSAWIKEVEKTVDLMVSNPTGYTTDQVIAFEEKVRNIGHPEIVRIISTLQNVVSKASVSSAETFVHNIAAKINDKIYHPEFTGQRLLALEDIADLYEAIKIENPEDIKFVDAIIDSGLIGKLIKEMEIKEPSRKLQSSKDKYIKMNYDRLVSLDVPLRLTDAIVPFLHKPEDVQVPVYGSEEWVAIRNPEKISYKSFYAKPSKAMVFLLTYLGSAVSSNVLEETSRVQSLPSFQKAPHQESRKNFSGISVSRSSHAAKPSTVPPSVYGGSQLVKTSKQSRKKPVIPQVVSPIETNFLTEELSWAEALGGGYYNASLNMIVPKNPKLVSDTWKVMKDEIASRIGDVYPKFTTEMYKIKNSVDTPEELSQLAEKAKPNFVRGIKELAEELGVEANFGPGGKFATKELKSLIGKVEKDVKLEGITTREATSKIGDALRGSIIVDTPEQIAESIRNVNEWVESQGGKIAWKNTFAEDRPTGYLGVHAKMHIPVDGEQKILAELQVHLRSINDGTLSSPKEQAHNLYKASEGIDLQTLEGISKLSFLSGLGCSSDECVDPKAYFESHQTLEDLSIVQKIKRNIVSGEPTIIVGSPGSGKSEQLDIVLSNKATKVFDLRSSFLEASGIPRKEYDKSSSKEKEFEWLGENYQKIKDSLISSKANVIVFDEFDLSENSNSALPSVKLILKMAKDLKKYGKSVIVIMHDEVFNTKAAENELANRGFDVSKVVRTGFFSPREEKIILGSAGVDEKQAEKFMKAAEGLPAAYLGILKSPASVMSIKEIKDNAAKQIKKNFNVVLRTFSPESVALLKRLINDDVSPDEIQDSRLEDLIKTGFVKFDKNRILIPPIVKEVLGHV